MPNDHESLADWVTRLSAVDIPVLRQTARELAALREVPDRLDARSIAHVLLHDPLMTVKLLRYFQQRRRRRDSSEVLQVEQVLMMLGLEPFFNAVPPAPLVDEVLRERVPVLTNVLRVVRRSHRASVFAMEWAARRLDLHYEEVRIAALLSQLAELMMWCCAPSRMQAALALQQRDRTLRSRAAQVAVFGFTLAELQAELARAWGLPELLQKLMDEDSRGLDRVRNVRLAVDLARHSANGWDDAALPDDYRAIASFLHVTPQQAIEIIGAEKGETTPGNGGAPART